jgi:phage gp36-like protein
MQSNSSLTSYASVADLLALKDYRTIAQLCSDDGANPIPLADLPTNINLLTILSTASGELESAVLRSGIYQVTDLSGLSGVSLAYLKKIVCDIAMKLLYSRRPGPAPSETCINDYNSAMDALNNLANGVRIFSFQQTQEAGLPQVYQMQTYDYINNNLVTARWPRMFGIRQDERRFW